MKTALVIAALVAARSAIATMPMTTTELNEVRRATSQTDQLTATPDLECTRSIVGIINDLDEPTVRCLPGHTDIGRLVAHMAWLLRTAVQVDPKLGDLSADEMVYRYIHIKYCGDRRPR